MDRFDLVVLGTGPAGHYGAIQGAKLRKKVAAIEMRDRCGGVSATTGTIPSKALREATLHLTGLRERSFYGKYYRVKSDLTVDDLTVRTDRIINNETSIHEAQLRRNGVKVFHGRGSFVSPHQIVIESPDGGVHVVEADKVLVSVGSVPAHPPGVDFDGVKILDSRQILRIHELPRRMLIVGAGIIGIEYACIFSALGVTVTLVNLNRDILDFVDRQVVDALKYHMQNHNVTFRLGEKVTTLGIDGDQVIARTASNKELTADCLLYSVGRQGNTELLSLEAANLSADHRGRLSVNEFGQTTTSNIYAAGDVIGFPALASTSREQGRRAVCHALGVSCASSASTPPYGIYSIPEISMFGATEQELTEESVPYEVGRARYQEIARGQIVGDTEGLLKILFHRDTLELLGVHIIGEDATELIHIGQAVHALGGTVEYFVDAVFNYPTLAECYKVAALDGINRLSGVRRVRGPEVEPTL